VHRSITYITKLDFFTIFKTAYLKKFIVEIIKRFFKGTKLILYNLDTVVLRLDIYFYILN
jgi:hypothetical protein